MIEFKQFAKHKDGTYASMDLTPESRAMLDNFVEMNLGLTDRVDPSTYHITLMYSRYPVPKAEEVIGLSTNTTAKAIEYEIFPTKSNGKCLVLRLKFTFAEFMNKKFAEWGATSDYPEYKPHLTLAYDTEQDIDVKSLPLPQFPLSFSPVKVAPLDPLFIPANK